MDYGLLMLIKLDDTLTTGGQAGTIAVKHHW